MLSEILAPLFGCHQQLLLDDLRGRWSFGMKSELEVSDDPVHCRIISDESDHSHLATACRTYERINFIDLVDHLRPAFAWSSTEMFTCRRILTEVEFKIIFSIQRVFLFDLRSIFGQFSYCQTGYISSHRHHHISAPLCNAVWQPLSVPECH